MNKIELLKVAKANGFADETPTLEGVKKFFADIDLTDANGQAVNVETAWNTRAAIQADTAVQTAKRMSASESKAASVRTSSVTEVVEKTFSIGSSRAEAKSYNAKAARGLTVFPGADEAEFAGASMRLGIAKSFGRDYGQRANDEAIVKTAITGDNTNAGALIPNDYIASLVYNTEKVGVARQITNVQRMSRDTQTVPRKTAIGAMSWVNEAGALPETDQSFDTIGMSAKKMGRIVKCSSEMFDDSAISIADTTSQSISESYDLALDTALILGDGTSTYGGQIGIANAAAPITSVNGAGTAWTNLTTENHLNVMATIKNADWRRCYWLCTREYYFSVMLKLDKATSQFRELTGPAPAGFDGWFLNMPVRFLPSITGFPIATAAATRCAWFGDFAGCVTLGERRDLAVEYSNQAYWSSDVVAWRATARAHINIHGSGRTGNSNVAVLTTT